MVLLPPVAALKAYANGAACESSATRRSSSPTRAPRSGRGPDLFELTPRQADRGGRRAARLFSATGQRWGNPLYRWEAHASDGLRLVVQRIRRTFELVDIVRIDHFRGFAGYWEILASEPTAVQTGAGCRARRGAVRGHRAALGPMPIIAEDLA